MREFLPRGTSALVKRSELKAATHRAKEREAERIEYAEAIDFVLAGSAHTVEESSAAWITEQRRFCELASIVRTADETIV